MLQTRGGTVTKSVPDSAVYTPNSIITLTATPAFAPCTFVSWMGDTSGSTNPLPLGLFRNKVDRTVFARFSHTTAVTVTTKGGSVVKSPDLPYYAPGITITATPAAEFLGWSGDTTGNMNPLTIRVTDGDMYLLAQFVPDLPGVGGYGLVAMALIAAITGGWVLWRRRGFMGA